LHCASFEGAVLHRASYQVAPSFEDLRVRDQVHGSPWSVHLLEEVVVGYCQKQSKVSEGWIPLVVRGVIILSKAQ